MPKESKKTKTTTKKSTTPPPLDIGLSKSGLVSGRKSMDIVPAGKTLPSMSAKPIIVSNRAVVKDPMAPPELTDAPVEKPMKHRKVAAKIVIEPLHENIKPEDNEVPDPALAADEPAEKAVTMPEESKEEIEIESEEDTKADEPDPVETSDEPDEPGIEVDDDVDGIKKSTEPKLEELERKKAEKRADEAAELVASKKYFLPINSVKKRRSTRLAWLFVVIIIVGVTMLALLDAGILDFVSAPTDFIPN